MKESSSSSCAYQPANTTTLIKTTMVNFKRVQDFFWERNPEIVLCVLCGSQIDHLHLSGRLPLPWIAIEILRTSFANVPNGSIASSRHPALGIDMVAADVHHVRLCTRIWPLGMRHP